MKKVKILIVLFCALFISKFLLAQTGDHTVRVGGADMYPSKNIVENAINSKDHTTLIAAVKAADLVQTLSGTGPFTVLAPTNKAFSQLPKNLLDTKWREIILLQKAERLLRKDRR